MMSFDAKTDFKPIFLGAKMGMVFDHIIVLLMDSKHLNSCVDLILLECCSPELKFRLTLV